MTSIVILVVGEIPVTTQLGRYFLPTKGMDKMASVKKAKESIRSLQDLAEQFSVDSPVEPEQEVVAEIVEQSNPNITVEFVEGPIEVDFEKGNPEKEVEEVEEIAEEPTLEDHIEELFGNENPIVSEEIIAMEAVSETMENAEVDMTKDRETLLSELREIYSIVNLPYIESAWSKMTNDQLGDLLSMVKSENGGSAEVASLIQKTKKDYESFVKSDMMKSRMKLIEKKATDHAKVIQTFEKMFGNDVIINGVKSKEYHEMLKGAVRYIVVLTEQINALASSLGITIPADEFIPNSDHVVIAENTPADPRVSMYVLNVFHASVDKLFVQSNHMKEAHAKALLRIAQLEKSEKNLMDSNRGMIAQLDEQRQRFTRLLSDSSYWIIKDTKGKILRKIDAEKPLRHPNDLDLRGTIDTALFLTSERAAETLVERLMKTRRFRDRELKAFRVSIVQS